MRLCVVGAGYVGLVVAACLADAGHHVVCVERDPDRLGRLRAGEVPLYEPGLAEIVARGVAGGRLAFHADLAGAVDAEVVFVAVGTPPDADGRPDLADVRRAVDDLAAIVPAGTVVAVKSTVPPGTADLLRARLRRLDRADIDVVSNPEFLAEGHAVDDFRSPDRVVLGTNDPASVERLRRVYAPLLAHDVPVLTMDTRSAELAKYASNAALAARLALVNEVARLAEAVGADIEHVCRVVGSDARLGSAYLRPGPGFGGSCFPKDLLALERAAAEKGVAVDLLSAVLASNAVQQRVLLDRLTALLPALDGARVAVWGLAYKAGTDDVRQSPALALVDGLLEAGAVVVAYDPKAMPAAAARFGARLQLAPGPWEAVEGADALVVSTEWPEFLDADPTRLARALRRRIVVDGRNLYTPGDLARAGLTYASIGRPVAGGEPRPPVEAGPEESS